MIVATYLIDVYAVTSGVLVVGVLKSVYCSLKAIGLSLQALVSALLVEALKCYYSGSLLSLCTFISGTCRIHIAVRVLYVTRLKHGLCCRSSLVFAV